MSNIEDLKKRFIAISGIRPMAADVVNVVKNQLGLKLPNDFLEIGKFFDGGGINVIPLHPFSENAGILNPISETLRLRSAINLPRNWIVLGEPPESLLLMDCAAGGSVIWIDAIDAERIASQSFVTKPQVWKSFSDFFEYLLDEEEADGEE